jgi:hypothetical protein
VNPVTDPEQPVAALARVQRHQGLAASARRILAALAFVALAWAPSALAADENPYLDKDGQLKQELVLIESQGGFAGFTGHRWTVATDGAWRRQPFLNEMVRKADASGKLSARQLAALADRLAREKLLDLPKQIGPDPMVNPKSYTLKFGKHETALILKPGAPLPKSDPKKPAETQDRFVRIAAMLLELMKDGGKKNEKGK